MRRWLRWFLVSIGVAIVVAVAGYTYVFHLGGIERFVINKINKAIGDQSNLVVSIERIRGSFFSGLVLEGVSIDYVDSVRVINLVTVTRASAQYSFYNVWNRTFEFENIYLDGVDLIVTRDKDGRWLLPLPGPPQPDGGSAVSFVVREWGINGAHIRIDQADDTLWVTDLNLITSLQSEGRTLSMEIRNLSFDSSDPVIRLDNLTGKATFGAGTLLFQDLLMVRDNTRLKVSGTVDVNELTGRVELAVDGLDLAQVSALTGTKLMAWTWRRSAL